MNLFFWISPGSYQVVKANGNFPRVKFLHVKLTVPEIALKYEIHLSTHCESL